MVEVENLPFDIWTEVFRMQTDMRSIVSLASASKHMCDILRRSGLIRVLKMSNTRAKQAVTPENQEVARSLRHDQHFCTVCWMCTTILPVDLEAIVVTHDCHCLQGQKCKPVIYTNANLTIAYQGDISHLQSPMPDEKQLEINNIPRPTVPPYSTTAC
jgi:ribosomal protein L36